MAPNRPTVFGSFALLQVRHGASLPEIRKAYRAAILREHPDKGGSTETFRAVSEAYIVLKEHLDQVSRIRAALGCSVKNAAHGQLDADMSSEDEPELPACAGRPRRQAPQDGVGKLLKRRRTMQDLKSERTFGASPPKSRGPAKAAARREKSNNAEEKLHFEVPLSGTEVYDSGCEASAAPINLGTGIGVHVDSNVSKRPVKKRQSRIAGGTNLAPKHVSTSSPDIDTASTSSYTEAPSQEVPACHGDLWSPVDEVATPSPSEVSKNFDTLSDAEPSSLGGESAILSNADTHSEASVHGGYRAQNRGLRAMAGTRNPRFLALLARVRAREAQNA